MEAAQVGCGGKGETTPKVMDEMQLSESRKNTINRIRAALRKKTPIPFAGAQVCLDMFVNGHHDLAAQFENEFKAVHGKVIYCEGIEKLGREIDALAKEKGLQHIACSDPSVLSDVSPYVRSLVAVRSAEDSDSALTACEFLVARTGTVVLSSTQPSGRVQPVRAPVHLIVAYADQLVADLGDAIKGMRGRSEGQFPSALLFASGPSRTGDIERTLILGMHGPRETFVFLVQDARQSDGKSKTL